MSLLSALSPPQADAVRSDAVHMASHMRQCHAARGHWFRLHNGLQRASAATSGRLVTAACLASLLVGVLLALR